MSKRANGRSNGPPNGPPDPIPLYMSPPHDSRHDGRDGLAPNGPHTAPDPGGANLPNHIKLPYLKAWRATRGLTQKELALRAGCTPETLRRIEHGRPAQVLTAAELARALAVPLDALRHTDPTMQP